MTSFWREELKQLAEVEAEHGCAISFYFQPQPPQDLSRKHDAILIKDLLREASQSIEKGGNCASAKQDLQRLAALIEAAPQSGGRARAIFACADKGIWKEYEVAGTVSQSSVYVNSRFRLQQLAQAVSRMDDCTVLLLDRENARILTFDGQSLSEKEVIHDEVDRKVKTDGFGGFDAGRNERHHDNQVMQHCKRVAERLTEMHTANELGQLAIVCRDEVYPSLEPHLHSYAKQKLLGHIPLDPSTASNEQIQEEVSRLIDAARRQKQDEQVLEALGRSQRDGLGASGLRDVIDSLEKGEVQTLILNGELTAGAVQCTHCGHLDTRMTDKCALCSNENRQLESAAEALVTMAYRNAAEVIYLDPESADPGVTAEHPSPSGQLKSAGGVAAVLRFRADQNTPEKLAS